MKETEIYFNFLLHVAAADGKADDEEIFFIEDCLEAIGVSDDVNERIRGLIQQLKKNSSIDGFDELLDAIKTAGNPSLLMTLIRDGYAMATSDGDIHQTELDVIKTLVNHICGHVDLFEDVMAWAKESLAVKMKGESIYDQLLEENLQS